MNGVINGGVKDDIDEIIKRASHLQFEESRDFHVMNRASSLSSPKSKMKIAIKERIRTLVAGYISLATFIDDDLVDFLEAHIGIEDKEVIKRKSRIYKDIVRDIERLEAEMRKFDPMKLDNT